MKVLITGGAGYLGTVLSSELLDAGHQVRVFDNLSHGGDPVFHLLGCDGFEIVRGDVRDAAALGAAVAGVDAVVHLAAVVGDPACAAAPAVARAVNLEASLALFAAVRAADKPIRAVFASTCSNYGKMMEVDLVAEDDPLRPVSLYAETKVTVERHLLAERCAGRAIVTVLRFATLYGLSPRMRFDLTVNEFTMELARGRRLTVFGEQFWRPYVHVRDASRAVHAVLEAAPETVDGRVFNVGSSAENYRKLDIVNLVRERLPIGQVDFVKKLEDPRDYRVSFERIARELGFVVTRRVPDGIREIAAAVQTGVFGDCGHPRFRNVTTT